MSEASRPLHVRMVCLGNICRSPMAEVVLSRRVREAGLAERVRVTSAGTGDWHRGEPADHRARAALRRRGYDGEAHRAEQFQATDFDTSDLVLAMDEQNLATLRRLQGARGATTELRLLGEYARRADPSDPRSLNVPDPYYGTDADFDHALTLVELAVDGLLERLQQQLGR